jgi:hypothetical protein
MENQPKHVELNNLLHGYPSVKPGQEGRAWKRLRDELYPKPDIIGMPKRFSWNLWGGVGVGSMAILAFAFCWYEVLSPFGMDSRNNGGSGLVPAAFKVPATDGNKMNAPRDSKDHVTPTNRVPANES